MLLKHVSHREQVVLVGQAGDDSREHVTDVELLVVEPEQRQPAQGEHPHLGARVQAQNLLEEVGHPVAVLLRHGPADVRVEPLHDVQHHRVALENCFASTGVGTLCR
jgi:hypothetical protein